MEDKTDCHGWEGEALAFDKKGGGSAGEKLGNGIEGVVDLATELTSYELSPLW